MRAIALIAGGLLLAAVLLDAFQSIILPRRPVGRFRITRLFFILTWGPWRRCGRFFRGRAKRDQFFSVYGPLSLLFLFVLWAALLTFGFGLVFFGMRIAFHDPLLPAMAHWPRLQSSMYVSGTTLFTLGLGDVLPQSPGARFLIVLEAGTGLGFIALVIGYVPTLYTAFSHREVLVALLDARAGSPPSASELLLRHQFDGGQQALGLLLEEWERWCAEMLETHISYPILCYYRSQHDNQSWLSALITLLDACAILITMLDGVEARQAQLTFAIGRHTLVDLGHVFHLEEVEQKLRDAPLTRMSSDELAQLCSSLQQTGYALCTDLEARTRLEALRRLYEPHACALAEHLVLDLPHWTPRAPTTARKSDAWTAVSGLRSPEVLARRLTRHVSVQATAWNLENHDETPTP